MSLDFVGTALPLIPADIDAIAVEIGVDSASVHAVHDIESAGSGFLADGRPIILFESHAFHSRTDGLYDETHPGISTDSWVRNYGAGGDHQYDRLEEAIALDREASLQSASWGGFQIMGGNHAMCGFPDVEAFVAAMMQSARAHLEAFAGFCRTSGALAHLAAHDWAGFARIYNGPAYAANGYDVKLEAAWRKWNRPGALPGNTAPRTLPEHFHAVLFMGMQAPNAEVLQMQQFFHANDNSVGLDGIFGLGTRNKVYAAQRQHGLGVDGLVGPATRPFVGLAA